MNAEEREFLRSEVQFHESNQPGSFAQGQIESDRQGSFESVASECSRHFLTRVCLRAKERGREREREKERALPCPCSLVAAHRLE